MTLNPAFLVVKSFLKIKLQKKVLRSAKPPLDICYGNTQNAFLNYLNCAQVCAIFVFHINICIIKIICITNIQFKNNGGYWSMKHPQSEMDHIKFEYIDHRIYIYLYVEKIPFVHWLFCKKIYGNTLVFFREMYTIDFMAHFLLMKVLIFNVFSFN